MIMTMPREVVVDPDSEVVMQKEVLIMAAEVTVSYEIYLLMFIVIVVAAI